MQRFESKFLVFSEKCFPGKFPAYFQKPVDDISRETNEESLHGKCVGSVGKDMDLTLF